MNLLRGTPPGALPRRDGYQCASRGMPALPVAGVPACRVTGRGRRATGIRPALSPSIPDRQRRRVLCVGQDAKGSSAELHGHAPCAPPGLRPDPSQLVVPCWTCQRGGAVGARERLSGHVSIQGIWRCAGAAGAPHDALARPSGPPRGPSCACLWDWLRALSSNDLPCLQCLACGRRMPTGCASRHSPGAVPLSRLRGGHSNTWSD